MNRAKSATNSRVYTDVAELLDGAAGYKYLGITENMSGVPKRETFESIKIELLARVERLCVTRPNAYNLIYGINEHVISLINYYVGVRWLEPQDYEELDNAIRRYLLRHRVHVQPACYGRLYLPRDQLGRGFHSTMLRSESMLAQLNHTLASNSASSTRRAAIMHVKAEAKTHLSLINS
ncbi:hypothetical protein PAPHI01_2018 [Pancytospora philotis]|nr:hypothetical protein PAPHI01_2018 [Pancytospora philotis]